MTSFMVPLPHIHIYRPLGIRKAYRALEVSPQFVNLFAHQLVRVDLPSGSAPRVRDIFPSAPVPFSTGRQAFLILNCQNHLSPISHKPRSCMSASSTLPNHIRK
jgi:hypothetical protein